MKDRAEQTTNTRKDIHFITSVAFNKTIYLLVQVNSILRVYAVKEFSDYIYRTPVSKINTVCGEGLSYAGTKTNENYMSSSDPAYAVNGNQLCFDFVPCEIKNTLIAEINIKDILPVIGTNGYILGDGDDLYIQKSPSKDYRKNKRYGSHSTFTIAGNLFLSLTIRANHPNGELYNVILGFFSDESVGFVDEENITKVIGEKTTSKLHYTYNNGKYISCYLKMMEDEPISISSSDIKLDTRYTQYMTDYTTGFSTVYNSFAKKQWVIEEYDIKITDNLNVRENL
jgi:hypothetical protein